MASEVTFVSYCFLFVCIPRAKDEHHGEFRPQLSIPDTRARGEVMKKKSGWRLLFLCSRKQSPGTTIIMLLSLITLQKK